MANIIQSRMYSPENENGERDVLYPETNSDSVITRQSKNGTPITLTEDIGPKIVVGEVPTDDLPKNSNRRVLQVQTLMSGAPNITATF